MSPADLHFQAPASAAHLSAAQLRQYAAGTLAAAERRLVERHTLACALCADALEGYQQAAPAAVTPAALAELQQRLHARVAEPAAAPRGGVWWLAAAAAVALLLVFVGVWQWPRSSSDAPVAVRQRSAAPAAAPESAAQEAVAPEAATAASSPTPPAAPPAAEPPAVAAAPVPRPRPVRARPALAAAPAVEAAGASADVALGNAEQPVSSATVADSSRPAVVVAAAPMPPAAKKVAPAASDSAPAKSLAMSRMAAPAPADSVPAFREEASKRKAELPPAPALAPFPVGGYPALRAYLRREQRRPETGIGSHAHSDGIVKLKFMVDADGAVHNIQVVRGVNPEYDEEAIRLVCEGPAWRPAIVNGRRTAQAVRLDVPFH